jgi:transcription termination/antitermination protein NusG
MEVFREGDTVCVKSGPFANFTGIVEEVDSWKGMLLVSIEIFGRQTIVQVAFFDAEKAEPRPPLTSLN